MSSKLDDYQKWNKRFARVANEVSTWSRDPSTKVGCVITKDNRIISTGYNGFPSGIDDTKKRLETREEKYALTIHAEANAILFAKQDLSNCFMYVTHYPCSECAKMIVQSGIKKVFYIHKMETDKWTESYKFTDIMFNEVGIYTKKVEV